MRLPIQSNPSRCILNTLEASCVLKQSAVQDGVQLVQFCNATGCETRSLLHLGSNSSRISDTSSTYVRGEENLRVISLTCLNSWYTDRFYLQHVLFNALCF